MLLLYYLAQLEHITKATIFLTGNKQSSKLEATHSSLGEELQNRSKCPRCHLDNLESLSAVLQANEED